MKCDFCSFVQSVCRFVGLQLTKIGKIVYIQDIADRETLSEAKPNQAKPSKAKQNKQAFNRILCVMANCLQSLLTSATIEINSKTFFWFICFSFVCWLQTLRFNFGPSTFCVEEQIARARRSEKNDEVFGNKVNGWSEISLVLQCSLKIVKCVRVALHSSIELCTWTNRSSQFSMGKTDEKNKLPISILLPWLCWSLFW